MYKTKLFGSVTSEKWHNGIESINKWLEENPNINIISANTVANHGGWGYVILYKESDARNDADEVD
jgi:hypothetical protein